MTPTDFTASKGRKQMAYLSRRQKLFVRIVADQNRDLERIKPAGARGQDDCPDCGVSGWNPKTGECAAPYQCCGYNER
jgi:hypothetical protein